jgi:hypothetical protein
MVLKNHVKDVTPGIPYSGQFIEHAGAEVLYVWCMETCSLVVQCYQFYSMFIDGKKLNLPAASVITIQMQAEPHLVIYQIQMFLNSSEFSTTSRCSLECSRGMDVELHRVNLEFTI